MLLDTAFLPMPPSPHPSVGWTFTQRPGGVSEGAWGTQAGTGGLNLGIHCGDDPAHAQENRRRVAEAIGRPVSWLKQVHGIRVLDLDSQPSVVPPADSAVATASVQPGATSLHEPEPQPEADAQITTRTDVALAVQVADCLPVLFADVQGRVVGAAHAGWRGLAGGVLEATVGAMRAKVPDAEIVAWLGPCIGPAAFEVGDDVREAFMAQALSEEARQNAQHEGLPGSQNKGACNSDDAGKGTDMDGPGANRSEVAQRIASAFRPGQAPGKWLADLPQLARLRLNALGIATIHTAGRCTYSEPQHFWSYRRQNPCGRMAGLIWLRTQPSR